MIYNFDNRKSPGAVVWLSIAASVLTITLKGIAFYVTDSVGFLSDAMESVVNLAAGFFAFVMLKIAYRPPDTEHPFGHDKAEYFSSLLEGLLIIIAALGIGYTAINRIIHPKPLGELNLGMVFSVLATIINLVTARILLQYGRKFHSITLEADSKHLMTDVWTTTGILLGIFVVKLTNCYIIDPLMAIGVALSIIYTGMKLIVRSTDGLMDTALSREDLEKIKKIVDPYKAEGIDFHALYTRKISSRSFISFHLLLPGDWSVYQGHELVKKLENEIAGTFAFSDVFIHMEPFNDPESYDDHLEATKKA